MAGQRKMDTYANLLEHAAWCFIDFASPCRWKDLESMFAMHASALSEVFLEVLERFVNTRGFFNYAAERRAPKKPL